MAPLTSQQKYFITLARYHKWAFTTLFEHINKLTKQQYSADEGLFFRSVQGTVNHLYLADNLWLLRFMRQPRNGLELKIDEEQYKKVMGYWGKPAPVWESFEEDREKIQKMILDQCDTLLEYVMTLSEDDLAGKIASVAKNDTEPTRAFILGHVFNHGTHHRGQTTAVITRVGLDSPEIDMVCLPSDLRDRF